MNVSVTDGAWFRDIKGGTLEHRINTAMEYIKTHPDNWLLLDGWEFKPVHLGKAKVTS